MRKEVVVEASYSVRPCSQCGRPTTLRCVCCGGRFCHEPCEPDQDHAVEPPDEEPRERW